MGGAVRLFPAAATMGVAEGIETALAASLTFEVPVWAALTAGQLSRFEPPPECRYLLIFMDRDLTYDGGMASNVLANRLSKRKEAVICEVRPATDGEENPFAPRKLDWADVRAAAFMARKMAAE
jgi:putative DNA primase/helicase